ncbi:MAG TPA: hypothetical protein VK203_14985 [Nostocaceae cyanobacterium]|nr:hypothetical protein [Nostocaceae cyanobacterium]
MYPISISTLSPATNCSSRWESFAAGVEYLFMGDSGQHQRQNAEGDDDFGNISIDALNRKPQLNFKSGRYEPKHAVPT